MRELSGRCPERRRCSAGRQRGLSRRQAPVVWAAIKAPLFPGCCCRRRREREKKNQKEKKRNKNNYKRTRRRHSVAKLREAYTYTR